jgi:hypothetical protein
LHHLFHYGLNHCIWTSALLLLLTVCSRGRHCHHLLLLLKCARTCCCTTHSLPLLLLLVVVLTYAQRIQRFLQLCALRRTCYSPGSEALAAAARRGGVLAGCARCGC